MSAIRAFIIAILLAGTVTGWGYAIFLQSQVIPAASQDDEFLAAFSRNFITNYVEVQAQADEYERLFPFLAGPADEAMRREAAAGAEPAVGLTLTSGEFDVIWRSDTRAMVEADIVVTRAGSEQRIGEHHLLELIDGEWRISQRWRLQIDPGTPIVAGNSEEPTPSAEASPSDSAAPSATADPESAPTGTPAPEPTNEAP